LTHEPELLFNIAQAQRMANNCPAALSAFERYRAAAPEPNPATADWLQELHETCPREAPEAAAQPPVSPPPVPEPETRAKEPRPGAQYWTPKRTLGWASAGAALGSALGGLWLARAANQTEQQLAGELRASRQTPGSVSWEQLDRLDRKGQLQNAWTVGLFGAAAVFAGVSVTLFATEEPERRVRTALQLDITDSQALWTWRGVY
jgi:hypothetical protein